MVRYIISTLFLVTFSLGLKSQSVQDALRYAYFQYAGTARSLGAANSFGALGGDLGLLSTNPAGIATFRRSEFTVSPGVLLANTTSSFAGDDTKENKFNLNISNAAVVFVSTSTESKWKTFNFSIGLNRLSNFNQKFAYEGTQQGTIADYFTFYAQDFFPEDLYGFEEGLAYETDLIYLPDPNQPTFYENDVTVGSQLRKKQTVDIRGGIDELSLGFGANLNHKFYVGLVLGLPFVNYTEEKLYEEIDDIQQNDGTFDGSSPFFNSLAFQQNLETTGAGFNLKLGMIYRASQMLRFGAAVHSPSFITLTDFFGNTLDFDITYDESDPTTQSLNTATSPEGDFSYVYRSPLRVYGDVGIIIDKFAFASAEVEWVNYNFANFKFDEEISTQDDLIYEQELNDNISNTLKSTINIRLGGEIALEQFRIRGGYTFNGNPYKEDVVEEQNRNTLHLGLGLRKKYFYVDTAFMQSFSKGNFNPYIFDGSEPLVENSGRNSTFVLTLGFKL